MLRRHCSTNACRRHAAANSSTRSKGLGRRPFPQPLLDVPAALGAGGHPRLADRCRCQGVRAGCPVDHRSDRCGCLRHRTGLPRLRQRPAAQLRPCWSALLSRLLPQGQLLALRGLQEEPSDRFAAQGRNSAVFDLHALRGRPADRLRSLRPRPSVRATHQGKTALPGLLPADPANLLVLRQGPAPLLPREDRHAPLRHLLTHPPHLRGLRQGEVRRGPRRRGPPLRDLLAEQPDLLQPLPAMRNDPSICTATPVPAGLPPSRLSPPNCQQQSSPNCSGSASRQPLLGPNPGATGLDTRQNSTTGPTPKRH